MKKIISFFLLLSISAIAISQGKTMESLTIHSKVLGKDVKYSIYLPSDYETSQRKYPVLYLLHGYSDDETGWTQFGEVQKIANESISKGEATQMIIVMPDAGVSWYINDAAGKVKYEDFFSMNLSHSLILFIKQEIKNSTEQSQDFQWEGMDLLFMQ